MRILWLLLLAFPVWAISDIAPQFALKTSGQVQDLSIEGDILYVATDNGSVELFDIKRQVKTRTISIPHITDFIGNKVASKVYSVDALEGVVTFVAQGEKGYRELWVADQSNVVKLIGIDQQLSIKKARFVTRDTIVLGLLSNQIMLYDRKTEQFIYDRQISASSFADLAISADRTTMVVTDESGIVREFVTKTGTLQRIVGEKNLDKVFQLDMKNGVVLTAGQDRKAVVYQPTTSYHFEFDFLLYSCGLSPKATKGAIAYNEANDILVFDVATGAKEFRLHGQDATLTKILFINEKELLTSSDSKTINFWRINR
jgi:WD40 repeat protein